MRARVWCARERNRTRERYSVIADEVKIVLTRLVTKSILPSSFHVLIERVGDNEIKAKHPLNRIALHICRDDLQKSACQASPAHR